MTQGSPVSPSPAPRPGWRRALPPLLAGALVAGLGWALLRPAQEPGAAAGLVGQPAPSFSLPALDGGAVSLAEYRGRPVVLNFWASWCGPCREEAPLLARLAAQPGGAAVVGVLFNETKEENARTFIRENALQYPNLRDQGAQTAVAYNVTGIPQTVFIDAAGTVRALDRGALDEATLNEGLRAIGAPALR